MYAAEEKRMELERMRMEFHSPEEFFYTMNENRNGIVA